MRFVTLVEYIQYREYKELLLVSHNLWHNRKLSIETP